MMQLASTQMHGVGMKVALCSVNVNFKQWLPIVVISFGGHTLIWNAICSHWPEVCGTSAILATAFAFVVQVTCRRVTCMIWFSLLRWMLVDFATRLSPGRRGVGAGKF
jgi:hypothetical protein